MKLGYYGPVADATELAYYAGIAKLEKGRPYVTATHRHRAAVMTIANQPLTLPWLVKKIITDNPGENDALKLAKLLVRATPMELRDPFYEVASVPYINLVLGSLRQSRTQDFLDDARSAKNARANGAAATPHAPNQKPGRCV